MWWKATYRRPTSAVCCVRSRRSTASSSQACRWVHPGMEVDGVYATPYTVLALGHEGKTVPYAEHRP